VGAAPPASVGSVITPAPGVGSPGDSAPPAQAVASKTITNMKIGQDRKRRISLHFVFISSSFLRA
jgi:hypothetical protein